MNANVASSLGPLNSDHALALRVDIDEARELAHTLRTPDFRNAENEAIAARLLRAAETRDEDGLAEAMTLARRALNLVCEVCGDEIQNADPSTEARCCSRSCWGE